MAATEWTAMICPTCGQSNMARVDPARRAPCGRCGASLGEAAPLHQDLQSSVAGGHAPLAEGPPPSTAYGPPPSATVPAPYPVSAKDRVRPYRPIAGLARALMILLGAGALLGVIAVVSDIAYVGLLERIRDASFVTIEEAEASDVRVGLIVLAQSVLFLATAVVFVIWFHRAYSNLPALGAVHRHGPGWAIGGWFVPILSLIRPKEIANDIWRASDPELEREVGRGYEGKRVSPLINLWWAAFLIFGVVAQFGSGVIGSDSAEAADLVNAAKGMLYGDIALVIAAVLALLTVKAMSDRQNARAMKYLFARPPD